MSPFRRLVVTFTAASILPAWTLAACSSSSSSVTPPPAVSDDAGALDAPLGPLFCSLPVPSTCPTTAPCDFAAWQCPQVACDGYFIVSDGQWVYYYSANGGALAGEVSLADASFVSCPYGFIPPTGCTAPLASRCAVEGGVTDAGATPDAATTPDATADADDAGSPSDSGNPSDAADVSDALTDAD